MKELLPLDDFEREIREAANGFEIKPRSSVFESIRQEMNAPPESAQAGKGTIVKSLFSKSLTFMSYAAAAAVVSVGSVFVYTQKQEAPDAVLEKNRSVKTYTLRSQSTEKEADELNATQTELYENTITAMQENTSGNVDESPEKQNNISNSSLVLAPQNEKKIETSGISNTTLDDKIKVPVNKAYNEASAPIVEEEAKPQAAVIAPKAKSTSERKPKAGKVKPRKSQAASTLVLSGSGKQDIQASLKEESPVAENSTPLIAAQTPTQSNPEAQKQETVADTKIDSNLNKPMMGVTSLAPDTSFTEKNGGDSLSSKKLKTNWVNVEGKRRFAISGFYTLESTYRTLSLPDQYDPDYWFDSYSNFRNQTDLRTQTFTAGLRLDYSLWKNLSIGTSLNYGERKESITINSYPEFEYDHTHQRAVITGYTKTAGTSIRTENLFRYVEIPLILSYYNNIGPRFSYRVSAGVGYSMLISASSYYINFDDPFAVLGVEPEYTYTNKTSSGPFRQMNSNLYLSANAGYLLNNRFEVFAGPSFKRSISSIYKDAYPVKQRFYSKGLEMGIRYFF